MKYNDSAYSSSEGKGGGKCVNNMVRVQGWYDKGSNGKAPPLSIIDLYYHLSSIYTTIYHRSILPFIIDLYYHLSFATRLQPRRQNVIGSSIDLFTIDSLNVMMMMMTIIIIRVFLFALRFQKFNHQAMVKQ